MFDKLWAWLMGVITYLASLFGLASASEKKDVSTGSAVDAVDALAAVAAVAEVAVQAPENSE